MGYEEGVKRRIAAIKGLRGKYAGVGPYRDEVSEARLAALREVREMVSPYIGTELNPQSVCDIIDAMIAKEERK